MGIVGKYSALQGFALFIWVVALILVLVGCITTKNALFIVPTVGIVATNGWIIYSLYKQWSMK